MKNILYIFFLFPIVVLGQSADKNYVKTATYREATSTTNENKAQVNVTYYDGLGRPIQQIAGKASPTGLDIITHMEYDAYSRQPLQYLPFQSESSDMLYDDDAKDNTFDFYLTSKYENTKNPYSQQLLEASPLGRVLKQAAPGNPWLAKPVTDNSDHTIKYDYQTNKTGEVRRFKVIFPTETQNFKPELTSVGYYAYRQLYKTITKDENWTPNDGKSKTTEEFKDKQGRLILKRAYVKDTKNEDVKHDTYYVYDDYGNLSYVIPPLASYQIIKELRGLAVIGTVNFPWVKLVNAGQLTTNNYLTAIEGIDNANILGLDMLNQYGGQGGFGVSTDEAGSLVLNINTTVATPQAYRTGEIASLDGIGEFDDKELGKIKGDGYEYYFLIRNNAIVVTGSGLVPSLVQTLSTVGQLDYYKNYPWTKICIADAKVASDYQADIQNMDNADILTTYIPNDYGAMGGFSVSLSADDNITLSVNISADVDMQLISGPVMTLDVQRPLEDTTLGTVSGSGYSYAFEIIDNVLYVSGAGKFRRINFLGSKRFTLNNEIKEEAKGLCYIYYYDNWNRLVEKHIPDNGWTYIVYNKAGLPILTQDSNLRISQDNNWMFTKYDVHGRVVYTGTCKDNRSRSDIQYMIYHNAFSYHGEERSTVTFTSNGQQINYTDEQYPCNNCTFSDFHLSTPINVLTVNYYDNYDFEMNGIEVPTTIPGTFRNLSKKTKGLVTGSLINVLHTANWITAIPGYDDKAREIWRQSKNDFLETEDIITTTYDFAGKILGKKRQHSKGSFNLDISDIFTYNKDLMASHRQKLDDNHIQLIAYNKYDELNRLIQKKVGGSNLAPVFYEQVIHPLQVVDYYYNVRGWLKGINDITKDISFEDRKIFEFAIDYSNLYNGNISHTFWKSPMNKLKSYEYKYDGLNRLTNANYKGENTTENYDEKNIKYDRNGNILQLQRYGYTPQDTYDIIDNLSYIYKPMSNMLMGVADDLYRPTGFNDRNTKGDDYDYDANGNMTKDLNKEIGDVPEHLIVYNHLNLPEKIYFKNGNYIQYFYDATGQKLQKTLGDGSNTITQYANGFVYLNGKIEYFSTPEGYARSENNTDFTYIYQYKDHLGNVRVSYADLNNDEIVTPDEIIEESDYYPFGMEHSHKNDILLSSNLGQKIKYNGKELQDELGLGWYDYYARNYDPAIARWMNIDPLAEKSRRFSPYTYALDNPVYFIDPDGMEADDWIKWTGHSGNVHVTYDSSITTIQEAKDKGYTNVETVFSEGTGTTSDGENFNFYSDGGYTVNGTSFDVDNTSYTTIGGATISENKSIGDALGDFGPGALDAGGNALGAAAIVSAESGIGAPAAPALGALAGAFKTLGLGASILNEAVEASSQGRGRNNRTPDPEAVGDHTVVNDRGSTTYTRNDKNPTGWQETKRVDTKGGGHRNKNGENVPTPHVHEGGNVRPAIPGQDMPK